MELMGWEGEGMADVSTGCVCYWLSCHLSSPFQSSARIDWGSPPLCNMTQKMGGNVWAHEHMEIKLLLSFGYTHTHMGLLFRCCHLPFGSIKAAFQTCSRIILLDLSQQKRFLSRVVNENLTCWIKATGRRRTYRLTRDVDTTCLRPLAIYAQWNIVTFFQSQPPTKQQAEPTL